MCVNLEFHTRKVCIVVGVVVFVHYYLTYRSGLLRLEFFVRFQAVVTDCWLGAFLSRLPDPWLFFGIWLFEASTVQRCHTDFLK